MEGQFRRPGPGRLPPGGRMGGGAVPSGTLSADETFKLRRFFGTQKKISESKKSCKK